MIRWLVLCASLLIAGCSVAPVKAPVPAGPGTLDAHAERVKQLSGWTLAGRAGVTTPAQAGTVAVDWRQAQERYVIELRAPWGAGTVKLYGGPHRVLLRTSDGQQRMARHPRELLNETTGLDLPIEALRYWLLGLPAPDAPARTQVDERGLLSELEQNDWQVRYLRYGEFDGVALPTKLFMRGDGVDVRVVVQRWEVER